MRAHSRTATLWGAGPVAVLAAASLWGTAGTAQELGAPTAAPWVVAAVRGVVGGALLLAVALALRRGPEVVAVLRRGKGPVAVATVALTLFQLGYLGGIRLTGVAVGTLVAIGSAPVWAGLHAVVTGRPPGRRWALGTVVTVAGAILLVLPGGGTGTVSAFGVALALIAGSGYATYTISSKRLLERGLTGLATVAVVFCGIAVLLSPLLVVGDLGFMATGRGLVGMAWLTVVATVLAYVLFLRGLAGVDAPTATTLTLAEPLMAALLGIGVVGERFTGSALAGAVLLAAGLALTTGRNTNRAGPPHARARP